MIITPELIEKAARAIHRQATKDGCDFGNWSNTKPEYLAQGRAAIEAILPDIGDNRATAGMRKRKSP